MAGTLRFYKMHGLGNDFVLIDLAGGKAAQPGAILDHLTHDGTVQELCDRRRGIGADGILILCPPRSPGAAAHMRVLNSDGSEPEMCGNGIRCAAKYLAEHWQGLAQRSTVVIDTLAGPRTCELRRKPGDPRVDAVRTAMGAPRFGTADNQPHEASAFIDKPLRLEDHSLRGTAVSMGNPHLVIFVEEGDAPRGLQQLARSLGPTLERDDAFPQRTNVEFAAVREDRSMIELWVWERGAGLTLACGTGACATVAAGLRTGRIAPGAIVAVKLPGGTLSIEADDALSQLWMEGPAEEVFCGQIEAGTPA